MRNHEVLHNSSKPASLCHDSAVFLTNTASNDLVKAGRRTGYCSVYCFTPFLSFCRRLYKLLIALCRRRIGPTVLWASWQEQSAIQTIVSSLGYADGQKQPAKETDTFYFMDTPSLLIHEPCRRSNDPCKGRRAATAPPASPIHQPICPWTRLKPNMSFNGLCTSRSVTTMRLNQ